MRSGAYFSVLLLPIPGKLVPEAHCRDTLSHCETIVLANWEVLHAAEVCSNWWCKCCLTMSFVITLPGLAHVAAQLSYILGLHHAWDVHSVSGFNNLLFPFSG